MIDQHLAVPLMHPPWHGSTNNYYVEQKVQLSDFIFNFNVWVSLKMLCLNILVTLIC